MDHTVWHWIRLLPPLTASWLHSAFDNSPFFLLHPQQDQRGWACSCSSESTCPRMHQEQSYQRHRQKWLIVSVILIDCTNQWGWRQIINECCWIFSLIYTVTTLKLDDFKFHFLSSVLYFLLSFNGDGYTPLSTNYNPEDTSSQLMMTSNLSGLSNAAVFTVLHRTEIM